MAIKRVIGLVLLLSIATLAFISLTTHQTSALSNCGSFPHVTMCGGESNCNLVEVSGALCSTGNVFCPWPDSNSWDCNSATDAATDSAGNTKSCSVNGDCNMHDVCVSGTHYKVWSGTYEGYPGGTVCSVGVGSSCDSNIVCSSGLSCNSGVCQSTNGGIGSVCSPWQWCGNGLSCSSLFGVCQQTNVGLGGACDSYRICSSSLSCNSGVCQQTNVGLGGACGIQMNVLCASGLTCTSTGFGICEKSNGQTCSAASECYGGFCNSGVCASSAPAQISCGGIAPSGPNVDAGAGTYVSGAPWTSWTFVNTQGAPSPCTWQCSPGYSPSGNGCVPSTPVTYSCTGTAPSGSVSCGQNTGLSSNTAITLTSGSCDGTKCQNYCPSGTFYNPSSGGTPFCQNKKADGIGCTDANQCNGGFCNSGVCASSAPAPVCPSGCVNGCVSNTATCLTDCAANKCSAYGCKSDGSGQCNTLTTNGGLGSSCNVFTWCASGYSCSNSFSGGVCQQTNVGLGGACSSNQICNGAYACLAGSCVSCTANAPIYGVCNNGQQTVSTTYSPSGCQSTGITNQGCLGLTGANCSGNNGGQCQSGICSGGQCQSSLTTQLSSGSWTDTNGGTISQADLNDRVVMTASGGQLSGKQVMFSWFSGNTQIGSANVTAQSASNVNYNTTISSSGTVTFKAAIAGGNSITSGNLIVSPYLSNSLPVPSIISPSQGAVYFVGNGVQFSHQSTDSDSNITSVLWDFGDGQNSNADSISHNYSAPGQKVITLTVSDEQGNTASKQTSITVLGSSSALYSFISQPTHQSAVVSSALTAAYNGQSSYALNITNNAGCITKIDCLSGACPSSIMGTQSCGNPAYSSTPIYPSSNKILFNWTFKDGNNWIQQSPSDSGFGAISGSKGFSTTGDKNITLSLRYTNDGLNLQQATSRQFKLLDQRQCSSDGTTWYQIQNGQIIASKPTIGSGANPITCSGLDGQVGTSDDCCPTGQTCTSGGCVIDNSNLTCSGYNDPASCNADPAQRAKNDPLWSLYGCGTTNQNGENILCNCNWANSSGSSSCQFNTNSRSADLTGNISSCTYSSTSGSCVNGYQQVTITASGSDPSCQGSVQTLPCGRPVVELPFVSSITLAGAALLIIVIYFFWNYTKNNKKQRR